MSLLEVGVMIRICHKMSVKAHLWTLDIRQPVHVCVDGRLLPQLEGKDCKLYSTNKNVAKTEFKLFTFHYNQCLSVCS